MNKYERLRKENLALQISLIRDDFKNKKISFDLMLQKQLELISKYESHLKTLKTFKS